MKILITAGPTREAIDPVRFLTNRSTGKMGYAIAEAAVEAGHEVVLISGPVNLVPVAGADVVSVESADEMFEAVKARLDESVGVAIFTAAVADYRPREVAAEKLKKGEGSMMLELERTRDILGSARGEFGYTGVLVGFAAETHDLEAHARGKLERKGCDLMVGNDVGRGDIGFGQDQNEVHLFFRDGREEKLAIQSKSSIARALIALVTSDLAE